MNEDYPLDWNMVFHEKKRSYGYDLFCAILCLTLGSFCGGVASAGPWYFILPTIFSSWAGGTILYRIIKRK